MMTTTEPAITATTTNTAFADIKAVAMIVSIVKSIIIIVKSLIITVLVDCEGSSIVTEGDVVISIMLNTIELGWTVAIE